MYAVCILSCCDDFIIIIISAQYNYKYSSFCFCTIVNRYYSLNIFTYNAKLMIFNLTTCIQGQLSLKIIIIVYYIHYAMLLVIDVVMR